MENIKQKAIEFSLSYGRANAKSLEPNPDRKATAAAVASHWKPGMVTFVLGMTMPAPEGEDEQSDMVFQHLGRYEKAGLGWRISLVKHEIVPYSAGSAACTLTWKIEPKNDEPGWQWTNVYGFRLPSDGKGGVGDKGFFEYVVADQEIETVLQRVPNFMEL